MNKEYLFLRRRFRLLARTYEYFSCVLCVTYFWSTGFFVGLASYMNSISFFQSFLPVLISAEYNAFILAFLALQQQLCRLLEISPSFRQSQVTVIEQCQKPMA
jgi:hypothetical protein